MSDDLVLGGLDVVGDDEDGFVLGAGRRGGRRARVRVPMAKWARNVSKQGVSVPEEDMDFLPFDAVTLDVSVLTTGVLIARPQRPFRGERLILEAADVATGADVAASCSINGAIFVGAVQVGASQGRTPFRTFAANAFGVRLSCPTAGQGTEIRIPVITVAAADVLVTATLIGRAIR